MTLTPQLVRSALAIGRSAGTSAAELRELQDARLRRLLCHAYESVPFYRKLFERHRLHPRHIRGTVDLDLIPMVSKQDLRAQPEGNVVARGLAPERLLTARTSGSSGEPFVIRRTLSEQSLQYLLQLRAFAQLGVRIGDRMAKVGLLRQPTPNDSKVMGRALEATRIRQRLKINGLQEPAAIVEQLRCYRPDVITGMSGMLCRVADYLLAHGSKGLAPRLLIVGGEVLTPVMRRSLRQGFGAPVCETYASHEFPLLGWQCGENGHFHTCDDGVILEVLHEGRPAEPGQRGEVVVTNLHAYAMPFIRYRLGDVATRGQCPCACGQPFSTIGSIQGRMIDYFPLPDGRVIHPYQILSSFMGGGDAWIRQYQLLQERRDRIVLRVLPAHAPEPGRLASLQRAMLPLLGPSVEFQVQVVDDLPLESTGKFRPSRSLVHSRYDDSPASVAGA
jgi:phenylacetate-CoA ligase